MDYRVGKATTVFDFKHSDMWVDKGILFCTLKPDLVLDISLARQLARDRKSVAMGMQWPTYLDVSGLLFMDAATQSFLFSDTWFRLINAEAIYIERSVIKFIFNARIMLTQPPLPVRVFSDRQEAIEWLLEKSGRIGY